MARPNNETESLTGNRDLYHNEFLDTGDLLIQGLLKNQGVSASALARPNEESEPSADKSEFFLTSKRARRLMRHKKIASVGGKSGEADDLAAEMDESDAKAALLLAEAKDELVALYQVVGTDSGKAMVVRAIEKIEIIQGHFGVDSDPFDPAKYKSGLETVEETNILVNANSVVESTVKRYRAHPITSISSSVVNGCPSVKAVIIGEDRGTGFVANFLVVAKNDFNGNEALDFVPDGDGVFTVKACRAGRFVDVSDRYEIDGVMKKYKVEKGGGEYPHSAFVGEKIAKAGKEILLSSLNLNSEDVKFGSCTVLCRKKDDAERIKKHIGVSSRK